MLDNRGRVLCYDGPASRVILDKMIGMYDDYTRRAYSAGLYLNTR